VKRRYKFICLRNKYQFLPIFEHKSVMGCQKSTHVFEKLTKILLFFSFCCRESRMKVCNGWQSWLSICFRRGNSCVTASSEKSFSTRMSSTFTYRYSRTFILCEFMRSPYVVCSTYVRPVIKFWRSCDEVNVGEVHCASLRFRSASPLLLSFQLGIESRTLR